jgi:hypothetical protein
VTIRDISELESDKNIASMIQTTFSQSTSLTEEVVLGGDGGRKIKADIALVTDPNGMKIGTVAVLREM